MSGPNLRSEKYSAAVAKILRWCSMPDRYVLYTTFGRRSGFQVMSPETSPPPWCRNTNTAVTLGSSRQIRNGPLVKAAREALRDPLQANGD